jgi:hypothetical protein
MKITLTEAMLDRAIAARESPLEDAYFCCLISQHPLVFGTTSRTVHLEGNRICTLTEEARSVIRMFDAEQYVQLRSMIPLELELTTDLGPRTVEEP